MPGYHNLDLARHEGTFHKETTSVGLVQVQSPKERLQMFLCIY